MKRAAILISALFLIAGLTFAQEPQKPVKKSEPVKTESTKKDRKDCPPSKKCTSAKKSGCCAHGKHASKPVKSDPDPDDK